MEVLIESKKVRLSPTLLTILATALTLGISFPSSAETNSLGDRQKQIIVTNGAALLQNSKPKNIKPDRIAQNPDNPQLPSPADSVAEIDPNLKLPEFEPSESEPPNPTPNNTPNPNGETEAPATPETEDSPESSNEPRV